MLEDYTTPNLVFRKAKQILGNGIPIKLSTRKDKKYMVLNPHTLKWVHFGQYGFEDYTKHKDLIRRDKFRRRNKKWASQDVYSPGWLAYYILW